MEQKTYVLGIDVGTQGLKAGIYTTGGQKVWVGSEGYPTQYPEPGLSEQDPNDWWKALTRVLAKCPKEIGLHSISAIAVCATSSTVLLVDESGAPVGPAMMWMDTRAGQEVDAINENSDPHVKEILRYSGGKVSAEWMTPKSLWLKNWGKLKPGCKIVEQLDWFNYRLTGNWVSSLCNATCKWNYVKGKGFSDSFFRSIQLGDYAEFWPTAVKKVGDKVGVISAKAAQETGFKEGVPVLQGGIDAHIGMLGIGATAPGEVSLIMGTSFVHLVHTEKAVFHPGLWGPYADAILPGTWLLEGGQLTCGSLTTWFLQQFYPDKSGEELNGVYEELLAKAKEIDPGSNGLVIMDSWQGNRTPYRNAWSKGTIYGLTLAHTKYDIFRAILESVAYGTHNIMDCYRESGVPLQRIIASGGGSKNSLWLQIISDVTGLTIEVAEETEAGTKGCAVISAFGLRHYPSLAAASKKMTQTAGLYQPDMEANEKYKKFFKNYIELHERLLPLMEKGKNDVRKEVLT